jgi:opacity protein-like surface antigen
MRRHTVPALLAAALLAAALAAPPSARAEGGKGAYVGTWSVSALAGVDIPNTDEYGNGFTWRLAAGYTPAPPYTIDLEVGGFDVGVSQREASGIPSYTIASGDIAVRYVGLTAIWRPPLPESYTTGYFLAGFGYYSVDYTMAAEPRQVFTSSGVAGLPDQKVEDAWGFHAGGGLEYVLSDHVTVVGEARYLVLRPNASGTASPGNRIDGSINLNTWIFTGGIRFSF